MGAWLVLVWCGCASATPSLAHRVSAASVDVGHSWPVAAPAAHVVRERVANVVTLYVVIDSTLSRADARALRDAGSYVRMRLEPAYAGTAEVLVEFVDNAHALDSIAGGNDAKFIYALGWRSAKTYQEVFENHGAYLPSELALELATPFTDGLTGLSDAPGGIVAVLNVARIARHRGALLRNCLLHEVGHLLGLRHSPSPNAGDVMKPGIDSNDTLLPLPRRARAQFAQALVGSGPRPLQTARR